MYTNTGIVHRNFNKTFPHICFKYYISIFGGKFDSVPNNITKNLQQPILIRFNRLQSTYFVIYGYISCFS